MITVGLEKLSKYERPGEPVSVALPLAHGVLTDFSKLAVFDGQNPVPTQVKSTALWPDGSSKWLFISFLADLPGNKSKQFEINLNAPALNTSFGRVTVRENQGRLTIDTGMLTVELTCSGESGIVRTVHGDRFSFEAGEFIGPVLRTGDTEDYTLVIGSEGWQVVESGPVRAVVVARGKHRHHNGAELMDVEAQITAFAGKPWLQVDYRMINREATEALKLKAVEFSLRAHSAAEKLRTAIATSNYETVITQGGTADRLHKIIDGDYLLYDMNEHFPETFYGTFFADWTDPVKGGVCITQYQAYQNFPKSFEITASGIVTGILPPASPELIFPRGVAKTHTLFLHFHASDEPMENLNGRSLQFQMPDRPMLKPETYQKSGIFENVFVERKSDNVERSLIRMADSRIRAYGILHWGDAPDPGYTKQGRGNGELVWTNNEYDFPHAMMLMMITSAHRRMLDCLLVAARHQMDVDVCHYHADPLRMGGQVIHSAGHISGYVAPCHQWVEGLLDFYHLTGDTRILETAAGIGENIMRILQQPRYQGEGGINARETGWAMRALVALYKETNDEKWLKPCAKIIDHFEIWKKEYGGWFAPYTDHTVIRVPFMIAIAVNSLMRYYRIRPEERIKQMILEAVDDLVENCVLENGLFYYKELPSLQRLGNNPLVLEALAYAYEFTGDKRYLEIGLPTFQANLGGSSIGTLVGNKQVIDDALITWSGDGPKRFAQSFHTLAYYYRAAREAGVLKF